ncbi:hypothetical protein D3C83_283510 [compost metagenome]
MLDIAEHVGGRLVDRHGARTGRRIGLLAGMHGERIELEELRIGHGGLQMTEDR